MQSIGERLEEARKRRGISIREAAETTKIRSDFLARFEESNFDINLPEIYVRGFLRNYARFLRINPETIVTDYTSTLLGEPKSKKETRELFGRMEIQERPKPVEPSHAHEEDESNSESGKPAAAPKPPGASTGSRSDWKDLVRLDNTVYLKIGGIILSGILAIAVLVWVIQAIVGSGGNSRADNESGTMTAVDSETINLIALEEVRVKVTEIDGGDVLFQGPLARGETRSVTKRGTILITYTAGANLLVEKGGQRFRMPTDGIGRSTFN